MYTLPASKALGLAARCSPTSRAAAAAPAWQHPHRVLHKQSGTLQQSCSNPQQQRQPCQLQRGHLIQMHAGPIDAAPAWTLDQIAGLVFGGVMLAFYFGSKEVDVFIAKQQRKQLGLCERCGGLNDPTTCSQDGCPMKTKPL